MANFTNRIALAAACLAAITALPAQTLKPEALSAYACYLQSAETRMAARTAFLVTDANPAQKDSLVRGKNVLTTPGNGSNPQKAPGALIYDWVGTIFIPGATVQRTVRMLQDYDHRASYFPEVIASSKLFCRTGETRFGFTMRLKEPVVADVDNDVIWERLDDRRWRCRSYSGEVREIGKPKGYVHRLTSYWRFLETAEGVFVEGQAITLGGEFGAFMRTLGSLVGSSPEKSLRKTLNSMRETLGSTREFAPPPAGVPACGQLPSATGCTLQSNR